MTETLVNLEGIERGPAGNTSLAAAFSLAQKLPKDEIIIVQETEYTGAGKHHQAQLSFARKMGIDICFGNPENEIPGKNIILPEDVSLIKTQEVDLDHARTSLIRNSLKDHKNLGLEDLDFLKTETKLSSEELKLKLKQFDVTWEE